MAMTDDERAADRELETKARNRERLEGDDALMTWCMFAGAAMAGGLKAVSAAKEADAMVQEALRRHA